MRRFSAFAACFGVLLAAAIVARLGATQFPEPGLGLLRDHPVIAYERTPGTDPVAAFMREVDAGRLRLTSESSSGYLLSALKALNIPVESQILVFSKTSFQAARIHPGNPRAIYFNDSIALGWVPGGFIEMSSQDDKLGTIFYRLDVTAGGEPIVTRSDRCVICHDTGATLDVPGLLSRSVYTGPGGQPYFQIGSFVTDHRSPLEERWGGWYVTGTHGSMRHLGNAIVLNMEDVGSLVSERTLNQVSLAGRVDMHAFPSAGSDIVALMLFEHQVHMTNLITRLGWESRVAASERRPDDAVVSQLTAELVDYMLFIDEAPLAAPITGTSGFDRKFAALGPFDRKGRSLRQLSLNGRMMRYPCSYLIYTQAFDALPSGARDAVYRRLWQVLSGKERARQYDRLTTSDRLAIIEILRDTKKDLPKYFL